jgi:hypothetical protein
MAQSIMHDQRDGTIAGEVREKQARWVTHTLPPSPHRLSANISVGFVYRAVFIAAA